MYLMILVLRSPIDLQSNLQHSRDRKIRLSPSPNPFTIPLKSLSFGAPAKEGVQHCIPFHDQSLPNPH
jgi:hypothetical protein